MPVMMTDCCALEPTSLDKSGPTSGTSMENAVLSMMLTGVFCSPNRLETSETVSPSLAAFWVVAMIGILRVEAAEHD
jgi:hypothetical protein